MADLPRTPSPFVAWPKGTPFDRWNRCRSRPRDRPSHPPVASLRLAGPLPSRRRAPLPARAPRHRDAPEARPLRSPV